MADAQIPLAKLVEPLLSLFAAAVFAHEFADPLIGNANRGQAVGNAVTKAKATVAHQVIAKTFPPATRAPAA